MTTPPCLENVQWFVMAEYAAIGYNEFESVAKIIPYPGNSRPPASYYTSATYYAPSSDAVSRSCMYRMVPNNSNHVFL